jgi:hypothetical protein
LRKSLSRIVVRSWILFGIFRIFFAALLVILIENMFQCSHIVTTCQVIKIIIYRISPPWTAGKKAPFPWHITFPGHATFCRSDSEGENAERPLAQPAAVQSNILSPIPWFVINNIYNSVCSVILGSSISGATRRKQDKGLSSDVRLKAREIFDTTGFIEPRFGNGFEASAPKSQLISMRFPAGPSSAVAFIFFYPVLHL